MQLHTVIFFSCQAAASGYALVRGGTPERVVAVLLAVAAIITDVMARQLAFSFRVTEASELLLDSVLLCALTAVAIFANRYWPIWAAAVQLDTIAVHGVRAYDSSLHANVYFVLAGYAAYPILMLLALGTLRHRHRVVRAGESEAAWVT